MAWWDSFFDDAYADIGLVTHDVAARDAVLDRMLAKLHVSPGATMFDQCCGVGRLSLPLAERGFRIIGVDQAASYIARATAEATRRGLACEFHAGNAFEFRAPRACDAAFNWFTSFGYDHDDRVNERMLQRAFDSLRSGGWFGLDVISLPRVLREFRAAAVSRHVVAGGELMLIQEPHIDFIAGMIRSDWTFIAPDGTRHVRRVENRTYMPMELVAMFARVGFVDVEVVGGDNEPFDRMSRRLVVYARRP